MNKKSWLIIGVIVLLIVNNGIWIYIFNLDEDGSLDNSDSAKKDSYGNEIPLNCIRWFDGCNNCVVHGESLVCTEMACLPNPSEPRCTEYSEQKESGSLDKTACENVGGYWGVIGLVPDGTPPNCIFPTSDAGKECTDSEQCESFCEAPEGSNLGEEVIGNCYEYDAGLNLGGCKREVKEGIFSSGICA